MRWMDRAAGGSGAAGPADRGGACALARALGPKDPSGRHLVCELDARVLALAREHLGLRRAPGLRVRHAEGREFVERQPEGSWDAVVVDAFAGALIPRPLITAEALTAIARAAPLALVNIVDDRAGRELALVAAAMREAYPLAAVLGGAHRQLGVDRRRETARPGPDRGSGGRRPLPATVATPAGALAPVAGTVALRDAEIAA